MKYKTGDKVRIKSDLKVDQAYGKCGTIGYMEKFFGKEIIIDEISHLGYVSSDCIWTDEMIEGLVEEKDRKIMNPNDWIDNSGMAQNINNKYHEDLMRISEGAMQGILARGTFRLDSAADYNKIANYSIGLAKSLLTQLKLEHK